MTTQNTANYDELVCSRCGRRIGAVGGFNVRDAGAGESLLLCRDCNGMVRDAVAWARLHAGCTRYTGIAARFIANVARRISQCGEHLHCA